MFRHMNSASTVAGRGFVIHVRFGGRSFDLEWSTLHLGPAADDNRVKHAIAERLEVPSDRLRDYVVDRHANGNLTVRPEAVFG